MSWIGWIAWAVLAMAWVILAERLYSVARHQQYHCQVGVEQGTALVHLLAALDDAGVVLPPELRTVAKAYRRAEDEMVTNLLADLDDVNDDERD